VIRDHSGEGPGGFAAAAVAAGSTVVSDGWSGYRHLEEVKHDPRVIGETPARLVLPRVHRVSGNAKRWAMGVHHGLRPGHLQADPGLGPAKPDPGLDELVFRSNRRRTPAAAFERLLGLAVTLRPAPYRMLISRS
jgi:ISXO2-like transposase domain